MAEDSCSACVRASALMSMMLAAGITGTEEPPGITALSGRSFSVAPGEVSLASLVTRFIKIKAAMFGVLKRLPKIGEMDRQRDDLGGRKCRPQNQEQTDERKVFHAVAHSTSFSEVDVAPVSG